MVRYFLLSLVFALLSTTAMAQTSVFGKVVDTDTGEELFGANVVLYQNGVFAAGVSADLEGNYSAIVDPGTYDVEVSYLGLPTKRVTGVLVKAGQANKLDIELGGDGAKGISLDEVIVTEYKVPLIEQDNTTSGQVITGDDIRNLPTKDVTALAATAAGLSQADEGDAITVRGSRDNATDYYIDGIRVRGSSSLIPQSEIDQLQVITGGIEAQYGDVTGGIISVTTKGPSSRYSGGIDVETSEGLDPFGYNLLSGYVSGPILRNKETGQSILGFRFSGQYRVRKDDDPPATDIFRIKPEKLAELEAAPVTQIGSTNIPSAEFLTNDDVEVLDYQPFEESDRIDLTAKIDARLSDAIDITVTGAYSREEDQFTPGGGNRTGANWRLLNAQNNPSDVDVRYRGNFRFRHRLGNSGYSSADGDKNTSLIQNAQYILQFGYEKREYDLSDPTHGDNFFGYGHVGTFDYEWVPFFGFGSDWSEAPFTFGHLDNTQTFRGYSAAGSSNPGLAAYNNNPDASAITDFSAQNGQFIGNVNEAWNFHTNVNQVYNLFRLRENDRYTLNVISSFDLVPKNSDKGGRHSIQFGIMYEQRVDRGYDLFPRELWNVARLQANRHILGVDTSNVVGYVDAPPPANQIPGVDSIAVFGTRFTTPDDLLFYQRVRQQTGQGLGEYVNVDGINPNDLSLDMFSPQELTDQDLVRYWGYDYLGNPISTDVTFDDFFTGTDANGTRSFPVAAFQPIYSAAFIQDKFTFKDVIFRLGLRVDRYDANTKVLKDIFSLYDIQNAGDFYAQNSNLARPPAVQDDYKVYVEEPGSTSVKAFRQGEQWFFEDGNPANDGNIIFGGQVVTPVLTDPDADIKNLNFDVDNSFEDYEPQVNWMPRLAFSFPISGAANFFAHYDVLVQRPASNTNVSALEYFYFNERTPLNNPNLRPTKTIDYEIGFQQKLSNSSAIKISAYYKEMRDMIQRRTVLFVPAPVITYDTYGNIDFGTVKGFTFQYDLRRTGNVMLNANYTLQFADGTGSDVNSQRGLTNRGNIRTLFPLNFDERHRIVTTLDYRYRSGRRYNGPRLFGKDIFADAGANIQVIAVSGRPYTAKLQASKLDGASTVGQINGARLPWNYTLNFRLDKSFKFGNVDSEGNGRTYGLNVYFRVQNVLDRRNVINVYPATGSATDDGYLQSPFGVGEIENIASSGRNVDSFLDAYQWRVLNPNFFSLPRRIFIGAIFDF